MLANQGSVLAVSFSNAFWLVFKLGLVVIVGLLFVYSLVVVRQVRLLSQTFVTQVSSSLLLISILFSGLCLSLIILFIWILF